MKIGITGATGQLGSIVVNKLKEKIAAENISAQHINGVLFLTLPKREEVKPATKQISIQ